MSKNVKSVEKRNPALIPLIFSVANQIRKKALEMADDGVEYKGCTRMPTKRLSINCRRSPCGEGKLLQKLLIFKVQILMINGK